MLWATVGEYVKKGLVSDSKVLDISNVDVSTCSVCYLVIPCLGPRWSQRQKQIVKGAILENDIPVFVVSFQTQELLIFRNAKTAEVVVGSEDQVQSCNYALVLTRDKAGLDNELTAGWKVVEVCWGSDQSDHALIETGVPLQTILTSTLTSFARLQEGQPDDDVLWRFHSSQGRPRARLNQQKIYNIRPIHTKNASPFARLLYARVNITQFWRDWILNKKNEALGGPLWLSWALFNEISLEFLTCPSITTAIQLSLHYLDPCSRARDWFLWL